MGVRFSRRVRIFPGVRVNLGLRGASLSLGPRGASVNIGQRGVYGNVGLGSGLSYRTRLDGGGGRRPSRRELQARARQAERERAFRAAQAEVEASEAAIEDRVDHWRDAPEIRDRSHFQAMLEGHTQPPPQLPDEAAIERAARTEARDRARDAVGVPSLGTSAGALGAAAVIVYMVHGALAGPTGPATFAPWAMLGWGALAAALVGRRTLRLRKRRARESEWYVTALSDRRAAAQSAYAGALAEWEAEEPLRRALVRRLLRGDEEAIDQAIEAQIEALDFPFDAEAQWRVDGGCCSVALDLPEIEDLVPEVRKKALKSGEIREVKRKVTDRRELYARAVTGCVLMVAAAVLTSAPTLERVRIAGYTQRKLRRSAEVGDDFILVKTFERGELANLDFDQADPIQTCIRAPGEMELSHTYRFTSLGPPSWVRAD